MLSISGVNSRLERREFLTLGSLGLGGLALPHLLGTDASAGQLSRSVTGRSVVFLFQQGGPSQLETFDPKMDASGGTRSLTGAIQTSVPGLYFGSTMSQLAKHADKLTVVRSFQTQNGGHNIQPIVGKHSLDRNIGTHYSRIVGSTHADNGMPTNAVIYPQSVDPDVPRPQARGKLTETGTYGSAYQPFVPGAKGQLQKDMQVNLPHDRVFEDRRRILEQLDGLNRQVESSELVKSMDELQQQAYQVLLGGGVSKALDLSNEDPAVLAKYDTGQYVRDHNWSRARRGKSLYYTGQAKTIGKLLLLSRRMCEAGCGFVTIHAGYAGVWDMHADGNNLNMVDGMQAVGSSFDHAVAAFIEDIEVRGLQDKILLVACGEMGRTPRVNRNGGRDHWSRLAPLLLYGGGIRGGQVIGQSDRQGGEPNSQAMTPANLISTIMHTVFDLSELRLVPGIPSEIAQLSAVNPLPLD
jgi:hypothetical protein